MFKNTAMRCTFFDEGGAYLYLFSCSWRLVPTDTTTAVDKKSYGKVHEGFVSILFNCEISQISKVLHTYEIFLCASLKRLYIDVTIK